MSAALVQTKTLYSLNNKLVSITVFLAIN